MSTQKTYTPEEAAAIAVEFTRTRVNQIAKSLKELRERELKKAIVPPHKHNTGTTSSSGVEDVPPSKVNPPGKDDAMKAELCKECGKSHMDKACGMDKAMLTDSKGKQSDNGIVSGSVLPDDKKSKEINKPTASDAGSGGVIRKSLADIHKSATLSKPPVSEAQRRAMGAAAGGNSTLGIPKSVGKEFIDEDKGGKLPDVKKAGMPPMAKPPSGTNMGTHVPTSKPAGGMSKDMTMVKDVKEMVVHNSNPSKPPKGADYTATKQGDKAVYTSKEELGKAGMNPNDQMKAHALAVAGGPAPTAPAPQVALPTPAQHADRAAQFAQHMPGAGVTGHAMPGPSRPGIFGRLGKSELAKALPGTNPAIRGASTVTQPIPTLKPAGAGLKPAGGAPALTGSATAMPEKTEVSLGGPMAYHQAGGTGTIPATAAPAGAATNPGRPSNMPKSPVASGPNALGSIIGAPPIVAPKTTSTLTPRPAVKAPAAGLAQAGAPLSAPTIPSLPKAPANKNAPTQTSAKPKV